MPKTPFNIQDQYLNQSRKERIRVVVQLMSGEKMDGYIKSFDNFSVLMEVRGDILIYKHAICCITSTMAHSVFISDPARIAAVSICPTRGAYPVRPSHVHFFKEFP